MGLAVFIGSIRISAVLATAMLLAVYAPAYADDNQDGHSHAFTDAHKQNVEHLLELMGVPRQVDQSAAAVLKLYSAEITDDKVSNNIKKLVNAYQTDLQKMVTSVLSWDAIKPNYINSYARRLSEADVASVKLFVSSPPGQKFIASQREAGAEIKQVTKHLIEADLAEPLNELSKLLREGLVKLQAEHNPK